MRKSTRLPEDLRSRLPEVGAYLTARPDVEFACLFGSVARGRTAPQSDVDIALYFGPKARPAKARLEILGVLMDILGTGEVDLVVLNDAPISLRGRVLKDRRVIADRNPFLRHRYESLTMREFFDFSVRERAILEGRYLHA